MDTHYDFTQVDDFTTAYYGMYTREGNAAVAKLVDAVNDLRVSGQKGWARFLLAKGLESMAGDFAEVNDTAVREAISSNLI
jgi:hypothetical protein